MRPSFICDSWKTCNCLQFGEMRLYATPEAVVEAGAANNLRPNVAPEDHLEITVRSVGIIDVFDGRRGVMSMHILEV